MTGPELVLSSVKCKAGQEARRSHAIDTYNFIRHQLNEEDGAVLVGLIQDGNYEATESNEKCHTKHKLVKAINNLPFEQQHTLPNYIMLWIRYKLRPELRCFRQKCMALGNVPQFPLGPDDKDHGAAFPWSTPDSSISTPRDNPITSLARVGSGHISTSSETKQPPVSISLNVSTGSERALPGSSSTPGFVGVEIATLMRVQPLLVNGKDMGQALADLEASFARKIGDLEAEVTDSHIHLARKNIEVGKELANANKNVADLRAELAGAIKSMADLRGELSRANGSIASLEMDLAGANENVADLQAQAKSTASKIDRNLLRSVMLMLLNAINTDGIGLRTVRMAREWLAHDFVSGEEARGG